MSLDLQGNLLGADQLATASMLVRRRECSAMCLIALCGDGVKCTCTLCHGRHHGKLNQTPVPGTTRNPRRAKAVQAASPQLAIFDEPTAEAPEPATKSATKSDVAPATRPRRRPTKRRTTDRGHTAVG